ncbi:hypothetical protein D3C81_1521350 [compost metagenome]
MRQRATEKQRRFSAGNVHRVGDLAVQQKSFAHVVQQHEQNDQASEGVNGQQPASGRGRTGERNCHERFAIEGLTAGADKDCPENFALPYNTKKQNPKPNR